MKKLSLLEWNIHAAASMGWNNNYEIKPWIVDTVLEKDCDVIIINEFVVSTGWDYFQKRLTENGYVWFMTYTSSENGLLLALKKATFKIKNWDDVNVTKSLNEDKLGVHPDFIHIRVKYNNLPLNIIGTRIKVYIKSNNFDDDYKYRKQQFDTLLKYVSSLEGNIIIMGDFNNGNIYAEYNKKQLYNNCARQYFNYQMIWREIEDKLGWKLDTPDQGGCYGDKFSIVTKDKKGTLYYTKEDHLISKGLTTSCCDYLWDFVNSANGYSNLQADDYKSNLKYIPDHAILYAEMQILEE